MRDDGAMGTTNRNRTEGDRRSTRRRYRVVVRQDLPTNLIDAVSAVHAAAVRYASTDTPEGVEQTAPELDEAGEDRSPTGSEG